MLTSKCVAAIILACASAAGLAQNANPPAPAKLPFLEGGFPPAQHFENVPEYQPQNLKLSQVPKASGARVILFNGKNLDGFHSWLGYANGSLFPADADDKAIGQLRKNEVFKVVKEDGFESIYISGRIWGALITNNEYGNYHLHLWYKFRKQWGKEPPNSGVLYHSFGPNGAFGATFMTSIEFEIKQTITGLAATIGRDITAETELSLGPGPGLFGREDFRYMRGGKKAEIHLPTMVKENRDVELPVGQWNKLDLYVHGDEAVQVINDVPCVALSKVTVSDAQGVKHPLDRGYLQLESEGTEIFMRDIWLEPIHSVPRVRVGR
jgi:Domain of Unknown Function (DUF1080)